MSQHDFNIANQTFPELRDDLNTALMALVTESAGDELPLAPIPYQYALHTNQTGFHYVKRYVDGTWVTLWRYEISTKKWTMVAALPDTALPGALDFNTLVVNGSYFLPDTGSTNGPGFDALVSVTASGTSVVQLAYGAGKAKMRMKTGTTWGSWKSISGDSVPVGTTAFFAGPLPPEGWLVRNGQAISRSEYAELFAVCTVPFLGTLTAGSPTITGVSSTAGLAVGMPLDGTGIAADAVVQAIGTGQITMSANAVGAVVQGTLRAMPFGVGDRVTTFNLPNAVDKMTLGSGTQALGKTGGEAATVLTAAQLPAVESTADFVMFDGMGNSLIRATSGMFSEQIVGPADSTNVESANSHGHNRHRLKLTLGQGEAHNNVPPFQAELPIIKAKRVE